MTNGNFDADEKGGNGFKYKYMAPTGWLCASGCAVIAASTDAWGAGGSASGANYLGLQNYNVSEGAAVTQTLAIPASQTLRITFAARYRPNVNPHLRAEARLLISLGSQSWSLTNLSVTWANYSYNTPQAVSGSINLTLKNDFPLNPDSTIQIDDVQVRDSGESPPPPPPAFVLCCGSYRAVLVRCCSGYALCGLPCRRGVR